MRFIEIELKKLTIIARFNAVNHALLPVKLFSSISYVLFVTTGRIPFAISALRR